MKRTYASKFRFCLFFACLVIAYWIPLVANANDSHAAWKDVASIEWGSHKIKGIPTQIKVKRTSVLVKLKNGKVHKIWQAKIKLKDGNIVIVEKGRAQRKHK